MNENRIGSYRIIRLLGRGAMGEVYLAEHELLRKKRALKILPAGVSEEPAFRKRFIEEGRLLAALEHPNIVTVHDMVSETNPPLYAIAMDFVSPDGRSSQTLDDLLRQMPKGRLDESESCHILRQICQGVGYAHSCGVIHRDLKPTNILLGADRTVRISDFGLAAVVGEEFLRESIAASLSGITAGNRARPAFAVTVSEVEKSLGEHESVQVGSSAAASLVGTYNFMPPEVQDSGQWTKQGDIYSIGVIAYVLVTGKRPVGRFRLPSELGVASEEYDEIVLKALAHEQSDRFASVLDISSALKGCSVQTTSLEVLQEDPNSFVTSYPGHKKHVQRARVREPRSESGQRLESRNGNPSPGRLPLPEQAHSQGKDNTFFGSDLKIISANQLEDSYSTSWDERLTTRLTWKNIIIGLLLFFVILYGFIILVAVQGPD